MNSGYCGVCGRRYSECVCGPVERSAEILAARIEAERARIAALERVAEAARKAMGNNYIRRSERDPLAAALQDLDQAPGEKERET